MLKSVFEVKIEENSKNYIYGTSIYSQMLFMNVLKNGIDLQGYVMEYNESEASLEYRSCYGQKVFNLSELRECNNSKVNIIGIGLEDIEIEIIRSKGFNVIIPTVPENVVIYGMGDNYLKTKEILEKCGCKIIAVTDSDSKKKALIDSDKTGIKFISKEELIRRYKSEFIVISVVNAEFKKQIEDWLIENCFEKISCMEDEMLRVEMEGKTYVFESLEFFFMNYNLGYEVKSRFFYGSKSWLLARDYIIKKFNIPITVGYISEDGFVGEYNGVNFISIYDLLTEDYGKYHVCVEGNINIVSKAREQVCRLGLEQNSFSIEYGIFTLFRNPVIDLRLGLMNDKKGYVHLQKNKQGKKLRIGILGGSTTDPCLYHVTSWSEYLLNILEINGIDIEIYNAAFVGNKVEDELLNFSRYLLPLELDVIISYSGVNDMSPFDDYSNCYARSIFEKAMAALMKAETGNSVVLSSVRNHLREKKNQNIDLIKEEYAHAKHWVDVQKIMHSECDTRGIRYIGILEPTMFTKKSLTNMERQCSLLLKYKNRVNTYKHMHKMWKELVENTAWAYDFTGIFDNTEEDIFRDFCHVSEAGNKIVAEKIAEMLLK